MYVTDVRRSSFAGSPSKTPQVEKNKKAMEKLNRYLDVIVKADLQKDADKIGESVKQIEKEILQLKGTGKTDKGEKTAEEREALFETLMKVVNGLHPAFMSRGSLIVHARPAVLYIDWQLWNTRYRAALRPRLDGDARRARAVRKVTTHPSHDHPSLRSYVPVLHVLCAETC